MTEAGPHGKDDVAARPEFLEGPPVLFDNAPTPLDINFRLAGFPVRVTPWFWLTMALLGSPTLDDPLLGPLGLVLWVVAGFVSILVHELGHAVSARWFRTPSLIVLTAFGGYAQYYDRAPPSGWRRLVVCLMGPIAGFILLGLVVVSELSTGWFELHPVLEAFGFYVGLQCLVWGLFNLLPVWPMDGGQAMREVFYILGLKRPDPATHTVSIFVIGVLILLAGLRQINPAHPAVAWMPFSLGPIMIFWFVLIGIQNWQMLQQYSKQRTWFSDDGDAWKR